jgi:hemin uptake protein HemP
MPQPNSPLDAQRGHVTPAPQRLPMDKRRIESQALFDGQVEIEIEHLSQVYRLRQTSLGKLILTK